MFISCISCVQKFKKCVDAIKCNITQKIWSTKLINFFACAHKTSSSKHTYFNLYKLQYKIKLAIEILMRLEGAIQCCTYMKK